MIESYDFGQIVIAGRKYSRDVIIFPNRIKDSWWRREGHRLSIEDVEEVVRDKPEILVVGTGYLGLMKIPPETRDYLKSKGIALVADRTEEACKIYNELSKSRKVAAALHLTC
jgi:hypothetical protein